MLTTKQRAMLRGLANCLEPTMQIGKEGITENSITQVEQMLYAKELVKIKVLQNQDEDIRVIANIFAEKTNSEVVQVIGRTMVLYKKTNKKGVKNIMLD